MSSVNSRTVLFFIAGAIPTAQEQDLIDRTVGRVLIRRADVAADLKYGASHLEASDAVAGLSIPSAYNARDNVTPATNGADASVTDGDVASTLTDAGVAAHLTTALTGNNNDLDITARQKGEAGNDITVEYASQAAGLPIGVVVTDKAIKVNLGMDSGSKQKDTATVAGTVTAAVKQVETATAAGTVTAKAKQVETATVVATITSAGNVAVIVTAAAILESPVTVQVAVAVDDDASAVAGKIRAALALSEAIVAKFDISGATDKVVLTRNTEVANDGTLNIDIADGTSVGVTAAHTSANTTAGALGGSGLAKAVVTAAGLTGSPLTVRFAVTQGDTAALWAAKARAALAANAAIAALFDVSGSTTAVVLTKKIGGANDGTLNIALDNDTSTGITTAATSANTTAGVAGGGGTAAVVVTSADLTGSPITLAVPVLEGDTAAIVAGKIRDYLNTVDAIVGSRPNRAATAKFTVGGSGATVSLERTIAKANDSSLNISVDNGTCTGLTTAGTSANTTAGAAAAISSTAAQVATAIAANQDANALVSTANHSGNDGTGIVTVLAATPLASGADPTVDAAGTAVVQAGALVGVLPS